MIKTLIYLVMTILLLTAQALVAQETPKAAKESGLVPFALPFYMPETSWGIGWALLYYDNADNTDPDHKPNEVSLYGAVTLNNQVSVGISTERYLRGRDYKLSGRVDFSKFPDLYWGVGPDTDEDADEKFTGITFKIEGSFLFKIARSLYLGPAFLFMNDTMREREDGKLLDAGTVPGSDGTYSSELGVNLNWDRRDSIFFPRRGFYLDLRALAGRKEAGSEYSFSEFKIDVRRFFQIDGSHVIGIQGMAELRGGTVPFQSMTRLGGDMMMRGYYQGRFRDRNFAAAQAEYRFPVVWRFTGSVFGGVGQVAAAPEELFEGELKTAFGLGLRFIADTAQHVPLRLDMGLDRDFNPNFYLIIKEAF